MTKQKVTKVVTISATFPELKGAACHQIGRGQGSSTKVALVRAIGNLLKQPKLKRKQFAGFTAGVSIGIIREDIEETPVEAQTQ